ncbi:MAG: DoxX family protein [Mycobacteriaceae bacterium]
MFIATLVVSVLLAAGFLGSAAGKLTKNPSVTTSMQTVGFPVDRVWMLAVLEIAGAVGLAIGLFWWPLGVAAAAGVILYFAGAVGAHLRVHDKNVAPAAVLLVVSVVALVLRTVSA